MRSYRKRLIAVTALVGVMAMSGYAIANVLGPATGTTVKQTLTAKVTPKVLPKGKLNPAALDIKITTGTEPGAPRPPRMMTATTYLDRAARINTRGLPTCPIGRITNTDTPTARKACRNAIVGTGRANATVAFPDQSPIPARAQVTVFNGVPQGGKPVFLIHAYNLVPLRTTFIVPGVYQRIRKGPFGYRLDFTVPEIAGGSGSLQMFQVKVQRKWRFRGRVMHYGYATCPRSKKLRIRLDFTYKTVDENSRFSGDLSDRKMAVQRCRG